MSSAISVGAEELENSKKDDDEMIVVFVEQSFDFKAECGVQESTVGENLLSEAPRESVKKYVRWFISVTSAQLAANIGVEIVEHGIELGGYLLSHEPDYKIVDDWAAQYNAYPFDYTAQHISTEYDTGCWTPAFPANPFCRIKNE